jgi:hypothetical protein
MLSYAALSTLSGHNMLTLLEIEVAYGGSNVESTWVNQHAA